MEIKDYMRLEIPGFSRNESFARATVAAFAARLDPTLEEMSDIKTAVSEAVTNAVIHAYEDEIGIVFIMAYIENLTITVEVVDQGKGINDVNRAMEPFYTSTPELERSGMGFTIMESFMDEVEVESDHGEGTTIRMVKHISSKNKQGEKSYGAAD